MGLSSQIAEKEDNIFCSDVRNQLFGPMEFSRRDLAAINIMRGENPLIKLARFDLSCITLRRTNGLAYTDAKVN